MSFLSLLPVRLSRLCLTWNLKWKACVLNTASIDVCLCVRIQDNGLFPSSTGYLSQRMLQVPSCYIRTKTSWLLADAPFSEKNPRRHAPIVCYMFIQGFSILFLNFLKICKFTLNFTRRMSYIALLEIGFNLAILLSQFYLPYQNRCSFKIVCHAHVTHFSRIFPYREWHSKIDWITKLNPFIATLR